MRLLMLSYKSQVSEGEGIDVYACLKDAPLAFHKFCPVRLLSYETELFKMKATTGLLVYLFIQWNCYPVRYCDIGLQLNQDIPKLAKIYNFLLHAGFELRLVRMKHKRNERARHQ